MNITTGIKFSTFLLLYLTFTLALNITFLTTTVNSAPSGTDILWEQHPKTASITLKLSDRSILVQVRNTSGSRKVLWDQDTDDLVKLFYVDDQGALIPLGDHPVYNDQREYQGGGAIWTDISQTEGPLKITITSEELAKLKTHPIISHIIVYDPATKLRYYIASPPTLLTEAHNK